MQIDVRSEFKHYAGLAAATAMLVFPALFIANRLLPQQAEIQAQPVYSDVSDYEGIPRMTEEIVVESGASPDRIANACGVVDSEAYNVILEHTPLQLGDIIPVTGIDIQSPGCPTISHMMERYRGCKYEEVVITDNAFKIAEEGNMWDASHVKAMIAKHFGDTASPAQVMERNHWREKVPLPRCKEVPR